MLENRLAPGSPQEWLARAKGDLALAGAPLPPGAFYEDLCFHAQQAAEEALKATYPIVFAPASGTSAVTLLHRSSAGSPEVGVVCLPLRFFFVK